MYTIASAKPISYNVYNKLLNESAGSRPFFVSELTGTCDASENDRRICRGAIQNALRSKKYRIIGSRNNVADYNEFKCDVTHTTEQKSREAATVNLFGSIKNKTVKVDQGVEYGTELSLTVHCTMKDAFTETLVYYGSGISTIFIKDRSRVTQSFSSALKKATKQAIEKIGRTNSKKNKNFIYAEAIGFDDGIKSTTALDLREAIQSAKVLIVEQSATRVRTESRSEYTFKSNGRNDNLQEKDYEKKDIVSDASIMQFEVLEDFGYVNGRYKIKIGARIVLN